MEAPLHLTFFLDENVDLRVGLFLRQQGYTVYSVREHFVPGSPDRAIVAAANAMQAIVVTWNAKHFRPIISRDSVKSYQEFPHAGPIAMTCRPSNALAHLRKWLPSIEFEYRRLQAQADRRLIVEISESGLRIR